MELMPDHPEIRWIEQTGYPSWCQPGNYEERCCECGILIGDGVDSYETSTHAILCEDCLKMLHKR